MNAPSHARADPGHPRLSAGTCLSVGSALILILLALGPTPAAAQQAPGYCTDFSPAACTRMTTVIESRVRPAYCKPGQVPTTRGAPLSTEQLRICYTMQGSSGPAPSLNAGNNAPNEKKLTDDTRAMVRQTWTTYGQSIKDTEIALKCNLVEPFTASLAIRNVQTAMHDLLIRAGLFGEQELNIDRETETYVQSGQRAAQEGACNTMTPLMRDQLRQTVIGLSRR